MRILFCNYEYPPLGGGGGVINELLAQELATRHEVTVLTSRALGLPAESFESGVRIIRAPVLFRRQEAVASLGSMLTYVISGRRAGRRLLSSEKFDVINTHFVLPSGPVGDALSRFARIPNVLTLHGGDLYDPSKMLSPHRHFLLRWWIRSLLRRSDIVVGQSKNTLENMRRYYTPEIEGVRVPLGIRRHSVASASRSVYGFGNHEILLVTVGRLVARKSIHQLFEVLDALREEPVRLLVIGSGPEEGSLRKLCAERRLQDRVTFLGQVDEEEKFRILQLSDIFVSTSQHEGFGLVFLEAMSCGLPVVCYDHGGQTDFLENEITGYLVLHNDVRKFTSLCRSLALDAERRQRMSRENLGRIKKLYIDHCAERYEEIFEQAIERFRLERLVRLSQTRKLPFPAVDARRLEDSGTAGSGATCDFPADKEPETMLGGPRARL